MSRKTLEEAVIGLISDMQSRLTVNERCPETNEYRQGFREALTGLRNDVPMIDVMDALMELGWSAPSTFWKRPVPPPADDGEPAPGSTVVGG